MPEPTPVTVERINRLVPSDLAGVTLEALRDLGGEAQLVEIIDRALELGGWSAEERAVVATRRPRGRFTCARWPTTQCRRFSRIAASRRRSDTDAGASRTRPGRRRRALHLGVHERSTRTARRRMATIGSIWPSTCLRRWRCVRRRV